MLGNHHQMTIEECIAVATSGSDGKPSTAERNDMQVNDVTANKVASALAEEAIERIELMIGIQLGEDRWSDVQQTLQADFAEAIQEAFDS